MKGKFIYVFGEASRDVLLANKYTILKSDLKNNIYVFENKPNAHFSFEDMSYAFSDTLTF